MLQRIQGYQQLKHDSSKELDEELRKKSKEEKKPRIRKKVRFNLDVVIYEPISYYDTNNGNNVQEDPNEAERGVLQSFPPGYRYNNWYSEEDYYDEDKEEDGECEFSDLEDDINDDDVINGDATYEYEHCRDLSSRPLISSSGKRLRVSSDTAIYGRSRRHYAVQVLNPVENILQWKAIKARKS